MKGIPRRGVPRMGTPRRGVPRREYHRGNTTEGCTTEGNTMEGCTTEGNRCHRVVYHEGNTTEGCTTEGIPWRGVPQRGVPQREHLLGGGLWVQSNSFLQITKSNFANNTATQGLIKVLDSSTLEMSDCNLQGNQAIDFAGAIFADKSVLYIVNTSFKDNKAIQAGGTLALQKGSFLHMINSNFSYNQVKFWSNARMINDGYGGAIFLSNSTANGFNINLLVTKQIMVAVCTLNWIAK